METFGCAEKKFRPCMSSSLRRRREVMARSCAKKACSIPGVHTGADGKIRISDSDRRHDSDGRSGQMIADLSLPAKRVSPDDYYAAFRTGMPESLRLGSLIPSL